MNIHKIYPVYLGKTNIAWSRCLLFKMTPSFPNCAKQFCWKFCWILSLPSSKILFCRGAFLWNIFEFIWRERLVKSTEFCAQQCPFFSLWYTHSTILSIIQQFQKKNVDTGPFIWDSKVCTLVEYLFHLDLYAYWHPRNE